MQDRFTPAVHLMDKRRTLSEWKKDNPPIAFRMDKETLAELDAYVRQNKIGSRGQAIREAIEWMLANAKER